MKIKYNHEIISGIVFALISSFLWFSIPTQVKTMEKTAITAQTLPAAGTQAVSGRVLPLQRPLPKSTAAVSLPKAMKAGRCLL